MQLKTQYKSSNFFYIKYHKCNFRTWPGKQLFILKLVYSQMQF